MDKEMQRRQAAMLENLERQESFPKDLESWQIDLLLDACTEAKEHTANVSDIQEIFDECFPADRRQARLEKAPEDKLGRKVRYYRAMTWEGFEELLKKGKQDTSTYDTLGRPITQEQIHAYFATYKEWKETGTFGRYSARDVAYMRASLQDVLNDTCPNAPEDEIQKLLQNPDNSTVRTFVENYVESDFVEIDHNYGTSNHMGFSPYLSVSVGGPAYGVSFLEEDRLHPVVELDIPVDQVTVGKGRPEEDPEKEVLVRAISRDQIVGLYASVRNVEYALTGDATSAAGDYHNKLKDEMGEDNYYQRKSSTSFFDMWRFGTKVTDCLPDSLREQWIKKNGNI